MQSMVRVHLSSLRSSCLIFVAHHPVVMVGVSRFNVLFWPFVEQSRLVSKANQCQVKTLKWLAGRLNSNAVGYKGEKYHTRQKLVRTMRNNQNVMFLSLGT